jgi:hypothetical protein
MVRLGLASLLALLVGGWFYASLYQRYGTLTAFNHAPGGQLHASQPLSFYTGLGLSSLFSKPVRPELKNRLFPILYSDVWGDYWGYFLIYVIDGRTGNQVAGANFENAVLGPPHAWLLSDYDSFGPYLGEVNLVSILPSLVLVAGIVYGLGELIKSIRPPAGVQSVEASWLLSLSLVFALAGYFWFLIGYSTFNSGGDTIKASYILQAYPVCALLVANLFEKVSFLRAKEKWLWVLGLVFLNNLPALLTHFFLPPW